MSNKKRCGIWTSQFKDLDILKIAATSWDKTPHQDGMENSVIKTTTKQLMQMTV